MNKDEILLEFIEQKSIDALSLFTKSNDDFEEPADIIAKVFGAKDNCSQMSDEEIKRLVASFKNNLTLLIQKTWVEKSDIALKEKLLYQLEIFLQNYKWNADYSLFLQIINQAVFLMFGQDPETPDFAEYTLRIDPEFGIFWWYISNLPPKNEWSESKCRIAMLLGMFFLANY